MSGNYRRLSQYSQPRTYQKSNNSGKSDIYPPYAYKMFTMKPSMSELADCPNGKRITTKTTVRFVAPPKIIEERWVSIPRRDSEGKFQWWGDTEKMEPARFADSLSRSEYPVLFQVSDSNTELMLSRCLYKDSAGTFFARSELEFDKVINAIESAGLLSEPMGITFTVKKPRMGNRIFISAENVGDGKDALVAYKEQRLSFISEMKKQGKMSKEQLKPFWKKAFDLEYRKTYVMELIDFRHHHWVPKNPGSPYTQLEKCVKRACPLCLSPDSNISTKRFGGRKLWKMSVPLYEELMAEDSKLGWYCIPEEGSHVMETKLPYSSVEPGRNLASMNCSSCGAVVINGESLDKASEKAIESWSASPHDCPSCGHKDFLVDSLFMTEKKEQKASRCFWEHAPFEIEYSGTKGTKNGRDCVNTPKYSIRADVYNMNHLVDAQDYGRIPPELRDPQWGAEPEDIGIPLDIEKELRPEPKSLVTKDRLFSEDFRTPTEYSKAIIESQAYALGILNPFEDVAVYAPEDDEEAIPF